MHQFDFADAASAAVLSMKMKHTIIAPWPLRVKSDNPHPSQKERDDFKLLLGSGHIGHERYVEWKVDVSQVDMTADTQVDKGARVVS